MSHVLTDRRVLRLAEGRHLVHYLGDKLLEGEADDLSLDALLSAQPGGLPKVVCVSHRTEVGAASGGHRFLF